MADSNLDVTITGRDELSPELAKLESQVIRVVGAVSAAIAGLKIAAFPITAAADFERELANVTKTTNFTAEQVGQLSDQLLKLSLQVDVSATDLAKIAAAAGQQGLGRYGVEGVMQFTDSVSRMASVLDITAVDAAENIGKIADVFKLPMSELEKAVASFNQVSNNSTARGQQLLDVVRRIGDAAGSLHLDQSIGLAASALDLGISPEVAGSAFSTMFAKMRSNAESFGKLMKVSATEWIGVLQTDGVGAFKQYLDALRELDSKSQANAIAKLTGGGRQGALLQKFVQDTTNTILDRDLAQAAKGYDQGTSALKEQLTVLNTLKAQATLLKNAIFAIGAEAGNQLTAGLTTDVAQLTKALQTPEVQHFVNAIVGGFGDLISNIVQATKFLGGLNINWENFIKVAEVFIGLKLATAIGDLATRLPGVSSAMKLISTSSDAAALSTKRMATASAEAAAAEEATQVSFGKKLLSMTAGGKAISDYAGKVGTYITAIKAQKVAEQELADAKARALADEAKSTVAQSRTQTATTDSGAIANSIVNQRAVLKQAQEQADADRLAQEATTNARLEQAEQAHFARMQALRVENFHQYAAQESQLNANVDAAQQRLASLTEAAETRRDEITAQHAAARAEIEAKYAAQIDAQSGRGKSVRIAAIQAEMDAELDATDRAFQQRLSRSAAGYKGQLTQAQAALDDQLAIREAELESEASIAQRKLDNEDAYYARSLNGLKQYGDRALEQVVAQGEAQVAAQRTALEQQQAALATAAGQRQSAASAVANTGAEAAASAAAAEQAANKLSAAQKAATTARGAITSLSATFNILTAALGTLARVATGAFFWVTIIFSVADALGLLDGLSGTFQKLTDAMGLTSKAARDEKLAQEQAAEAYQKKAQALQDLIDKTAQYKNAQTGSLDKGAIGADITQLTSADTQAARNQGMTQFLDKVQSAFAEVDQLGLASQQKLDGSLNAQQANIAKFQKQIEDLQAKIANPAQTFDANGFATGTEDTTQYSAAVVDLQKKLADAQTSVKDMTTALGGVGQATDQVKQSLSDLSTIGFSKIFTQDSANVFEDQVVKIGEAKSKLEELTDAYKKAAQAQVEAKGGTKQQQDQAAQATNDALTALQNQNVLITTLQNNLRNFVSIQLQMPGIPDSVKKSYQDLLVLAQQLSSTQITAVSRGLQLTQQQGVQFTGSAAGALSNAPKPTGTREFDAKANADALNRAKLDLAKAEAEARINLQKETDKELSAMDQFSYDQGLISIQDYYAEKQRIELKNNAFEIEMKQKELAAAQDAVANADKDPARIKAQADVVKIQGQINVLRQQQNGIVQDNANLLTKGMQQFQTAVLTEAANAVSSLIAQSGDNFALFFEAGLDKARLRIQVFESELKAATGESKTQIEQALAALKIDIAIKAAEQAIAPFTAQIGTLNNALTVLADRMQGLVTAGLATSAEMDATMRAATQGVINATATQISGMEDQLAHLRQANADAVNTEAYQNLALQIEGAKNGLIKLNEEANKFAITMNQSIANSFKDALASFLDGSVQSLNTAVKNFGDSIKKTLANSLAEDFTQSIVKNLGIGGSGGIGGLLQMGREAIFGAPTNATNEAVNGIARAGLGKPDGSANQPFWVRLIGAEGAAALGGLGGLASSVPDLKSISDSVTNSLGPISGLFGLGGGETGSSVGDLAKKFGVGDNSFGFSMPGVKETQSIFDGFTSKLGDLFDGLGSKFTDLFQGFGNLFSGGGSGDGILGSIMGLFGTHHTGGIAGSATAFKMVSPSIFRDAMRFHSGGLPGLSADEVPAILQKGEEVLTRNDPRNVLNGGTQKASVPAMQLQIHPDAINMTLRDWMEGELARINANR